VQVTTIGITPPDFTDGYQNGYPILDVPRIHKAVKKLIAAPKPKAAAPAPTVEKAPAGQDDAEPTETTKPKSGSSGSSGKSSGNEVEQSSDACGIG
jgi:hypothetical protein